MSDKNKGGPAFPQPAVDTENGVMSAADFGESGMTLRDYFAAQSIAGINPGRLFGDDGIKEIAENAYKLADAMLKARG